MNEVGLSAEMNIRSPKRSIGNQIKLRNKSSSSSNVSRTSRHKSLTSQPQSLEIRSEPTINLQFDSLPVELTSEIKLRKKTTRKKRLVQSLKRSALSHSLNISNSAVPVDLNRCEDFSKNIEEQRHILEIIKEKQEKLKKVRSTSLI